MASFVEVKFIPLTLPAPPPIASTISANFAKLGLAFGRRVCRLGRMETTTETKPLPSSLQIMTDAEFSRRMKLAARKAKKAATKKWRGF